MVMVTTRGLVTVTVSMVVMAGPVRADALWAAKLAATAAASHGEPLWKIRLGRMVMVHTV
jgi:hypothetical protein